MTGHNTLGATAAAAIAVAAAGPLAQVLNELAAVMAIMGACGGLTWGLANRLSLRDTMRGLVLGALMAFGFGMASPHAVQWATGIEFEAGGSSVNWLASCAFFLGMAQDLILAKLRKAKQ